MRNANVFKRIIAGSIAAALLTACGGGGASQATLPASPGGGSGTLAVTIKLPATTGTAARGVRRPLYTSRSTAGIGIEFQTAAGGFTGAASISPQFGSAVSATSAGCSAGTATDGSYTCTFYIPGVSPGYVDLRVALWNAAPVSCSLPNKTGCSFATPGNKVLSVVALANQSILTGQTNAYSITTLPVVDSINVALPTPFVDGTAATPSAVITLKDAAGDIITGTDTLMDAAGNTLTVTANINNNKKADGTACGTLTPVAADACALYFNSIPASTTANGAASATINYTGTYAFTPGSPTVSVAVNHPVNGVNLATPFSLTKTSGGPVGVPAAPQYTGHAAITSPASVASASDGKLYVAANTAMYQVTPATGTITPAAVTLGSGGDTIGGVASGPDGDVWWTDITSRQVYKQLPGTASVNAFASTAVSFGFNGGAITAAADGNMWFIDTGNALIDVVNVRTMAVTQLIAETSPQTNVIVSGTFYDATAQVCYPSNANTHVGCWKVLPAPAGFGPNFTVPAGSTVTALAFGPDGLCYVGSADNHVYSFGPTGSQVASYSLTSAAKGITLGHDGAMWVTEGTGKLARIGIESTGTPPAVPGILTEYALPSVFNAAATSANLGPIVLGSDNQLWTVDTGLGQLDQITP